MPRTPMPRAAIIGISGYGKIYLERLLHHAARGELKIAAATVINRSEERAVCADLEGRGAVIYGDYHQMFEAQTGRLDLVLIPTGIHWHARMTLAALAAGANVLVEGVLGSLRRIKGRGLWPRDNAYYARNDWAGRIRVGSEWVLDSPLANALAHFLNLALFLAGGAVERSAQARVVEAELYRARSIENFDTAAIRIRTRSGVEICFYATHSCATVVEPELHLEGTEGTAVWGLNEGWRLRRANAGEISLPARGETQARREMFARVLRRLRDPQTFICGPEIAAEHTLCVNGAQTAAVIRDVPPFFIEMRRAGAAVSTQPVITDINRRIDRAFAAGSLLHEVGGPWTSPAGQISLESFGNFSHPAA